MRHVVMVPMHGATVSFHIPIPSIVKGMQAWIRFGESHIVESSVSGRFSLQ